MILSKTTILLLLLTIISSLGFFSSRFVEMEDRSMLRGWDNAWYYFWVRSLVIDGDVDFSNEVEQNNLIAEKDMSSARNPRLTDTERIPNKYGVGWALVTLPLFLLAHGLTLLGDSLGVLHFEANGFTPVYQIVVQTGHYLIGLFSLYGSYRILRIFFAKELSLISVCVVWLSSLLLYYQTVNLSMAHSLTYALFVAVFLGSLRLHLGKSFTLFWFFLWGLAGGLMVATRYQTVIYLLIPLWAFLMAFKRGQVTWRFFQLGLLGFLIPVCIQLLAWKVVYGDFLVFSYGQGGEGFKWGAPAFYEVLFSANHGFFYWHPLMGLGLLSFGAFVIRRHEVFFYVILSSLFIMFYVNASWWCWWLGSSFGLRAFECWVLLAAIGLGFLLEHLNQRWQRMSIGALAMLAVAWNINLCILYCVNVISRNSAVTYLDVINTTMAFYPEFFTLL